ncbi:hypothetical protein Tco_1041989 [Tanacetum coccineum]|uniref:Reverse transcriptase domain-containing protein n=1 Tax=Tanacetum coccineum TaxID=301880 RepID=A0ABQ5GIG7_9ASTR
MTPLPGFSTPPQIPNVTTSERPPITTTVFAATTPENTPFAYHASTLTNPNLTISPAFDYDEEREMEPRLEPRRETAPTLRLRSPRVRRQRERVVGFEDAPNREGNRRGMNAKGIRPSKIEAREGENKRVDLPSLLAAHLGRNENSQPLRSSLTSVQGGNQPSTTTGGNHPPNEDYPLMDRLKMPSYIGSYDGKGDPDNFLHIFKGSIRMQKWLMPVACHMLTYALKYSARIWWNSQKMGSILNYEDLKAKFRYTYDTLHILGLHEEQRISGFVHGLRTQSLDEHLSTDLPSSYKDLMEKAYTWVKARESQRDPRYRKSSQDFRTASTVAWSQLVQGQDKIFPFPDYGHEINQCRELKHQIEEAVKSGKLAHLVKGVKEKKEKTTGTSSKERKKEEKKPILDKVYVLMIKRKHRNVKKRPANHGEIGEITFPPLSNVGSADPVIIKVYISGRQNHYATNGDRGVHSPWSYKVLHAQRTNKTKEDKPSPRKERSDPKPGRRIDKSGDFTRSEVPDMGIKSHGHEERQWEMEVACRLHKHKQSIRDPHPLPTAEQKAKGLHKYRLKCFLDAYKGYH